MRRIMIGAVIGLLCIGGAANAQGEGSADIVRARQAALMMSGVTMGAIKAGIDANQPLQNQRFNTRALSRWAHALSGMFPVGSGPEAGVPTKALSGVWTDRAGFEEKAAAYAAAADRLSELSQGEDAAAFAAQWTEVRATCQSCHDVYRE
ncbi:c-type cytochrome [Brevundimonas lenta]|uniref:Cytochrome c556 n=1 Tax=Brevundimonas lenta TaxID=424796 RepID=A0A7W6JHL6_9CAUL|nr:cytochrome c [Brevundimonas lenta]MBB4084313.1 cytochrome c556 [Brevundimonas lenta]